MRCASAAGRLLIELPCPFFWQCLEGEALARAHVINLSQVRRYAVSVFSESLRSVIRLVDLHSRLRGFYRGIGTPLVINGAALNWVFQQPAILMLIEGRAMLPKLPERWSLHKASFSSLHQNPMEDLSNVSA